MPFFCLSFFRPRPCLIKISPIELLHLFHFRAFITFLFLQSAWALEADEVRGEGNRKKAKPAFGKEKAAGARPAEEAVTATVRGLWRAAPACWLPLCAPRFGPLEFSLR